MENINYIKNDKIMTLDINYVHGYSETEMKRLHDQAQVLKEVLHNDSNFPDGSLILDAGCGIGAQSEIILQKNRSSKIIAVDCSKKSIAQARKRLHPEYIENIEFVISDLHCLPFDDNTFDYVVVHFVLEHISNPYAVIKELKRVLKTGGEIMVVEGDHGSIFFYPESVYAQQVIDSQSRLQSLLGGHTNVGRELFPMFDSLMFDDISATPIPLYIDNSKPKLAAVFIKEALIGMIEGIRDDVLKHQIIDLNTFDKGVADLHKLLNTDGVFCYTFIKLIAKKL